MSVKIYDKKQKKWIIFPGTIGAPGKDAYLIAQENGYTGTKEEYAKVLTDIPKVINSIEEEPTEGSKNLITSGGVWQAIDNVHTTINNQIKSSIVDNLESLAADKSLSANQGRILKEMIANLANLQIEIVDQLPSVGETNIIYLVKKSGSAPDIHDEYVFVDGKWEKIGDTEIDLSNYYTRDEVDDKLTGFGAGDVMASGDLANNYIVVGAGTKSIKKSEQLLSDLALKSDIPSLDGYATESWVGTQNFITMPEDLAEDRIVIGAGTNSVTSKRLKTINGVSLLVDDIYNVTNYNVSRMFPWYAFTGSGNITGLYNYLFDGVGQLIPIEYNNSAYTNLPVDGESFVGTLQPYKYTAANNWSVRAFLTSENTGKTYTGVFNMGQSALINWIEIGKDITSSEIVSALGFTPISSNEIPVALPNPYALSITANGTNNSYTGSSVVNINLDSIFSKKLKTVTTPGQPGIFVGTGATYEVDTLFVSADEPNAIIVIPSSTSISFDNTIYTEMQDLGTLTGGTYKCYCITYINSSIVLVNGAIYGNS